MSKKILLANCGKETSKNIQEFLEKIKDKGPIFQSQRVVLHVNHSRFQKVFSELKGLPLQDAFKQIKWNRRTIDPIIIKFLEESIVKAQEVFQFDPKRTFIADIHSKKGGLIQSEFLKKYVKGRGTLLYIKKIGRYGSTPTPLVTTLELVLQDRSEPFSARVSDPFYEIKQKLRDRVSGFIPSLQDRLEAFRRNRPLKKLYE
jgi:hypothetical protein